jgi:hypothetical protein
VSLRTFALAAVIASVMAARTAWAETTYAYVTQAEPDWESAVDDGDYCDLTLQVPKVALATAPTKAADGLLEGATLATAHADDPDRTCFDLLHTWQHVDTSAGDPAHVHVKIARQLRFVFEEVIEWAVGITFAFGVLLMIAERIVRKRYARRHRAARGHK